MSPFDQWIGQPVIMQVKVENSRSTLEGTIIGDALNSLHFQPRKGRRIHVIAKSAVLAIEEALGLEVAQSQRRWEMPLAS